MKPSTAKAKGAKTETMFVEWLRTNGVPHCERRHLCGTEDQGDIGGWPGVCIEVKSGAKVNVPKWMAELETEMINSRADTGAIAVRPKGKPNPNDWWIMMPPHVWLELMTGAGWIQQPKENNQ